MKKFEENFITLLRLFARILHYVNKERYVKLQGALVPEKIKSELKFIVIPLGTYVFI